MIVGNIYLIALHNAADANWLKASALCVTDTSVSSHRISQWEAIVFIANYVGGTSAKGGVVVSSVVKTLPFHS